MQKTSCNSHNGTERNGTNSLMSPPHSPNWTQSQGWGSKRTSQTSGQRVNLQMDLKYLERILFHLLFTFLRQGFSFIPRRTVKSLCVWRRTVLATGGQMRIANLPASMLPTKSQMSTTVQRAGQGRSPSLQQIYDVQNKLHKSLLKTKPWKMCLCPTLWTSLPKVSTAWGPT